MESWYQLFTLRKSWYPLFEFEKSVPTFWIWKVGKLTNFLNLKSRYQLFQSEKSGTNFLNVRKLVPTFSIWKHSSDFCKVGEFARICTTDLQTPFRFAWLDLQLSLRFTRVQIYKFSKRQGLSLICNFWDYEVHIDL